MIWVVVRCAEDGCVEEARVEWPEREYRSTLFREVCLDGTVELPEGWRAAPAYDGFGDNLMRCPVHAAAFERLRERHRFSEAGGA